MAAYLDMELAGRGAGWTEITDVLVGSMQFDRGLPGGRVTDCVADAGQMSFQLDNTLNNSAKLVGYYSPDHANCRSGFRDSIWVRIRHVVGATTVIRFTGVLDSIRPVPGTYGPRTVSCQAVGWMDVAASTRLSDLPVQVNKTGDQVFQTLIDSVPSVSLPRGVEKTTSADTYPYSLDRTRDEQTTLREELYRLALSGLDKIWVRGNGVLVYEPRVVRFGLSYDLDTFTDHHGFEADRSRASIINKAQFTVNPRVIGSANSVMFALSTPMELAIGAQTNVLGPWTDINNPDVRVGAVTLTALVAGTDYSVNSLQDGTGVDLTSFTTVTQGLSGNATDFGITVSASSGATSAWLRVLQQRGTPLLVYGSPVLENEDASSVAAVGTRPISVNMPYQSSLTLGLEAAQYVVFTRKASQTEISGFTRVVALNSSTELLRSLQREISERIGIQDSVTGLTKSFFIESIRESVQDGFLTTRWELSPVDSSTYWYIETVGKSELETTTVLGFGYVVGHTDIAAVSIHSDVAHTDTAHSDTHTDVAHTDITVAHGDGATHGDVASVHIDSPFEDGVFGDVAHIDSHSDTTHTDVPHDDFHGDSPFGDSPMNPPEYHDDAVHDDTHNDTAHSDVTHVDSHSDTAHTDTAFGDEAHEDITTSHVDNSSHSDYAGSHTDTAHGDVSHTDTAHGDIAHGDAHTDVAHGDVN
ncbi:hypothetical protein UFOVP1196_77 [uncultured Caudovirales phage]|uniref:Uncharacterized protein n=1 Tax=uncultured Caudovirales phage TaxID=2100421 RepID=A0A6J5RAP5_9CAUD|nr:hypothetical protein UFOVP1196_77 [uncultured Caudovirales phage]